MSNFYFCVTSEEYGFDEYGEYDTEQKAIDGLKRVQAKAKELDDGIKRTYSYPYQGSIHA